MPLSALLVLAAITDKLVDWATTVVGDLGLAGIFVLMTLDERAHPDPVRGDDAVRRLQRERATYSLFAVVSVGVLANLLGSCIAYAIGDYGRLETIERHDTARTSSSRIWNWADLVREVRRRAVFFSRMLPIIRTFISLPAGAARMPFGRFVLLTVLGCIPWILGLDADRQAASAATGRPGRPPCTTSTTRSRRDRPRRASTWSCAGAAAAAARLLMSRRRRPRGAADPPRARARPAARARGAAAGLVLGARDCRPWLLGWPDPKLDPELRKAFEVAVHAGTARRC